MEKTESKRGKRTVINILDEVADTEPSRPICSQPRSSNPSEGWNVITYLQAANAVNFIAQKLASNPVLEEKAKTGLWPTVAYIGPGDWRYFIFMVACIKAGCVAFLISPRNSLEGQKSLFEHAKCQVIYYAEPHGGLVMRWLDGSDMQAVEAPTLEACIAAETAPFPYQRTFEEARWDPLVIVHTSGSTGIPKHITIRQGSVMAWEESLSEPDILGIPAVWKRWHQVTEKMFLPMPMFHAAGAVGAFMFSLCAGKHIVLPPAGGPLSADVATACLLGSAANSTMLPPTIIEEMVFRDDGVKALAAQDLLITAGGNLARLAGDILVKRDIQICNLIGSTETICFPQRLQTDLTMWQWFIFDEDAMGAEWDPVDWEDDVYELVIKRKAQDPGIQTIFYTFPDIWSWRSRDLYKKHPTLANYWEYFGRADDVIVFSNGEKLNPVTIETLVSGCEQVKGVIVAGQDRFQPLLVLEAKTQPTSDAERDAFLDEIWPVVENANEKTVAHGRIARWMMMVASPDTPFARSPKGTVQRGATTKALAAEIDAFYKNVDETIADEELVELDVTNLDKLTLGLVNLFQMKSGIDAVSPDTDIFTAGVDSLQVLNVSTILQASVKHFGTDVDGAVLLPRWIYKNPTPQLLAKHIINATTRSRNGLGPENVSDEVGEIAELVTKYTADLPSPRDHAPDGDGQTVLLTGSTGSLGSYILDILCRSTNVTRVYALNRGEDGGKNRQPGILAKYGLSPDLSKVSFVAVDLSKKNLGLADDVFTELSSSADVIIHNAWPVNFKMSLASFEPHIRGVRHLVDLSCAAAKHVPIVFVSTISTVINWKGSGPVPESRLEDLGLATMGYGQSKLAASMVLDAAASTSGISAAHVRLGQVAGCKGKIGLWNPHEYLPSLVASSVYMGMLPADLGSQGVVDWVAVEDVAGFITDVAGITADVPKAGVSGYLSCVNPKKTTWRALAPAIQEHYADRIQKLVDLDEWVAALEASAKTSMSAAELEKNPGAKLTATYRGMLQQEPNGAAPVQLSTTRAQAASPTMTSMEAVTPAMMKNWCTQWDIQRQAHN